jgi:hypothetical protein
MLARLGSLLKEKGRLSRILVDKADGVPHHSTHVARYGTMGNAYELIGHHPKGVFNYIGGGNSLTTTILKLATDIIAKVEGTAGSAAFNKATDVLTINGELAVLIDIARCRHVASRGCYGRLGVVPVDPGI